MRSRLNGQTPKRRSTTGPRAPWRRPGGDAARTWLLRRYAVPRAFAFGLCAALTALGCRSTPAEPHRYVFFPAPPMSPRVQFLTWASGADEVEPTRGAFEEFILGEEPMAARAINKPYGIAARDGVVYVCDTKGMGLCRLDFKNRKYGVLGVEGPGRLRKPINVVIDPAGFKFVADTVRKQIVVFDAQDRYVTAYEVPEPCHPVDVAVDQNELYVLDNDETCQIVVLDRSTGQVVRTFGSPGGEPGQFKKPGSLAIGPDGSVYVCDTHNWRVQKLTREGKPVWVKGTPGYRLGEFGRPRGVRVGPDGIIYVVDAATEIVQMFDADGQTLMRFGGPGDLPGALGLPSTLWPDRSSIDVFQSYVHKDFQVDYLLFVASQYGPRLVNVYAFGSFPEGYKLRDSDIGTLPPLPLEQGIGPVGGPGGEPASASADPRRLKPAARPEPARAEEQD